MAADTKLLEEFKELIESVSLEILKEAQMKEVAKDVVTRSYKAEIADALEVISGEIERVQGELKELDYISADEIKALVQGAYDKQESDIKEREERIKNIIDQRTQELYISGEKLRSEMATVSEQVESNMRDNSKAVEKSIAEMGSMHKALKEGFEKSELGLKAQMKKLFLVNYGLIAAVMVLLIFILVRGSYGA